MLDSLGCALYGADLEWCRILQDKLERIDATHHAAFGAPAKRLSAPHAALVNGTAGAGLRTRRRAPRGRAACRRRGVAGADRGHGTETRHERQGVSSPLPSPVTRSARASVCAWAPSTSPRAGTRATLGVFSAAAGAARVLKLDVGKTVHALGIAGTQAGGLMAAQYGAMVKRMHAGRSSQTGLYGALFAEAPASPASSMCSRANMAASARRLAVHRPVQPGGTHRRLGEVWQTMGVALKFYACVGSNHTTLDALRDMQQGTPLRAP